MNTTSSTARVMAQIDPPSAETVAMAIDADIMRMARQHCPDAAGMGMGTQNAAERLRRDVIQHLAQTDARLAEILRAYFQAARMLDPLSSADFDDMTTGVESFREAVAMMADEMDGEAKYFCGAMA